MRIIISIFLTTKVEIKSTINLGIIHKMMVKSFDGKKFFSLDQKVMFKTFNEIFSVFFLPNHVYFILNDKK